MNYKIDDIVLIKSSAGDAIPHIHVRLLKRIVIKPRKGRNVDWPGYSGWEATPVYQKEIDTLRKKWSIPFTKPEKDLTFVYDRDILHKEKKK